MKRKVIIAAATAAVLVGGGTATAVGVTSGSGGDQDAKLSTSSQARHSDDDGSHEDAHDQQCGDDDRGDNRDDSRDDAAQGNADRDEDTGNAGVSVRQASEAVLKAAPGTITELELDSEDNRLVWEADVAGKDGSWHKVEIDATTGKVVKNRVDHDTDDQNTPRKAELDAVAAAQKAASATKGAVTSVDLERDGTKWEIDTVGKDGTEHELDIDAATGKVLKHETERADVDEDAGDDD